MEMNSKDRGIEARIYGWDWLVSACHAMDKTWFIYMYFVNMQISLN